MPDLYIFKTAVGMADPVALQYQNVAIHFIGATYYRRVDFLESIPEFQAVNMGPVLATNQSGRTNVINLEMADNEFGVFRWYPIDDFQCLLFHPAGISKGQLRNLQVPFDMTMVANDPNLVSSEIAVWEDNRPAMIAVNGNAFAIATSRVRALGYRFHVIPTEPMTQQEKAIVQQIKTEHQGDTYFKKTDADIMNIALSEGRLPVTHIWASGRGTSD